MRKFQFSVLKFSVVFAALVGLVFFSETKILKSMRGAVVRASIPFINVSHKISRIWELAFGGLTAEESQQLILENQELKARGFSIEKLVAENELMSKALGFKEKSRIVLKGARVILYSRELGKEFLIIDQGEEDGVSPGNSVISPDRLFIGTVHESGRGFSKVRIASNTGEAFEAEIIPVDIKVLAKGLGGGSFSLELIPAGSRVRRGDFVALPFLNSESFLMGEVTSANSTLNSAFQEVKAVFLIRPGLLHEVFVVHPVRDLRK